MAVTLTCALVLIIFLVWAMRKMTNSGMKTGSLTSGVISLAQPTNLDGSRVPKLDNGNEYGISLWLYINQVPNSAQPSPILSIDGSPVFAFDNDRSNVLVRFPEAKKLVTRTHATFGHVSLRRWVHLMAVHVDGTLTLFKDGELHTVDRLSDDTVVVDPMGSLRLGGNPCDAYVSAVSFLNHSPSYKQVKSMYRSGPQTTNWLFKTMGFANLGVRSPVYIMPSA